MDDDGHTTIDQVEEPHRKRAKQTELGKWKEESNGSLICFIPTNFEKKLLYTNKGLKIASFDFDDTLVKTKSGKAFATNSTDWKEWDASLSQKLRTKQNEGFLLVIFTNQNGVTKRKLTVNALKSRLEEFMRHMGEDLRFFIFAAINEDHFRKPAIGMWEYMSSIVFKNAPIDMIHSIYVGDAAGRPKNWMKGKKKDHSCSDRKFALNVGIQFATPEVYFLGEKEFKEWSFVGYDIEELKNSQRKSYKAEDLISQKQEIILFVGLPASGKTSFFKRHFEPNGYIHINRDTLKTAAACLKACIASLSKGKSVVVDNTNPDPISRAPYIRAAKKQGVPIRCFYFSIDEDLAKHLNMFRENDTKGSHKHVPRVGYNMYKKRFVEPKIKEGFSQIKIIDFVPIFDNQAFDHYT